MLFGSLLFVAAGFWMLSNSPMTGYLSIIFFGLCAVAFAISLLPNSSYLRLTPEGSPCAACSDLALLSGDTLANLALLGSEWLNGTLHILPQSWGRLTRRCVDVHPFCQTPTE